jgi:hypothetical protein
MARGVRNKMAQLLKDHLVAEQDILQDTYFLNSE